MKKRNVGFMTATILVVFLLLMVYTAKSNRSAMPTVVYTPKNSIVVIDAGHGGIDGGAVCADGTPEKEINLAIAQRLDALFRLSGIRTVMTRSSDDSIHDATAATIRQKKVSDIHNRLKIMNDTENAVFVSIHQNHFTASKYKGTQVFYSGNDPQSKDLASHIQQSVVAHLQPENTRTVKKSGTEIYLLYHATKPAVMVECGFLSNPEESELLKTADYQTQMAMGIYRGILNFFTATEEV